MAPHAQIFKSTGILRIFSKLGLNSLSGGVDVHMEISIGSWYIICSLPSHPVFQELVQLHTPDERDSRSLWVKYVISQRCQEAVKNLSYFICRYLVCYLQGKLYNGIYVFNWNFPKWKKIQSIQRIQESWCMSKSQFEIPLCYLCPPGTVVVCWFRTQEMASLNTPHFCKDISSNSVDFVDSLEYVQGKLDYNNTVGDIIIIIQIDCLSLESHCLRCAQENKTKHTK